jgi:hypothetical protein
LVKIGMVKHWMRPCVASGTAYRAPCAALLVLGALLVASWNNQPRREQQHMPLFARSSSYPTLSQLFVIRISSSATLHVFVTRTAAHL